MDQPDREQQVLAAIRVSAISVAWAVVVGLAALGAGISAGSLALIGFGIDSTIDGAASVGLIWRFRAEKQDPARAERVEHLAERIVAIVLALVALYLTVQGIRSLATHAAPAHTTLGTVLATASVLVLPVLAVTKVRIARRIGSRALRADGVLSAAGALLGLFALVGLLVDSAFGWWWADSVAALLISAILARESWRGLVLAGRHGTE
ncbi:MAG TPA: cation transporter [Acidimicrobiales bacterium]|jgi:divalent metal cation (Fe/Co/Zn/Cd) transporter